jgi:hypothetical protein
MKGKTLVQLEVMAPREAERFAQFAIRENRPFRCDPLDRGEQFTQERRYRTRVMVAADDQAWAKKRLGQIRGREGA